MKENISELSKNAVMQFRQLNDSNKLYFTSVVLNHITNGQINEGNYLDSDTAYENDELVFEANYVNLDDPMKLATNLLVIASAKDGLTINPNGMDIEPYIKDKKTIAPVLSTFYKLEYRDKIDFLTEIFYDISEIKEVEKALDFDFNELVNNFLDYSKTTFGIGENNNLETE